MLTSRPTLGYMLASGFIFGSLFAFLSSSEQVFREALAEHPDQAMLRVNLGLALRQQGRDDEAIAELERVVRSPGAARLAGQHLAQIALEEPARDEDHHPDPQRLELEPHVVLAEPEQQRGTHDAEPDELERLAEQRTPVAAHGRAHRIASASSRAGACSAP